MKQTNKQTKFLITEKKRKRIKRTKQRNQATLKFPNCIHCFSSDRLAYLFVYQSLSLTPISKTKPSALKPFFFPHPISVENLSLCTGLVNLSLVINLVTTSHSSSSPYLGKLLTGLFLLAPVHHPPPASQLIRLHKLFDISIQHLASFFFPYSY